MVAASFVPLLLDVGSLRRSLRDLRGLVTGAPPVAAPATAPLDARTLAALFIGSIVTLVIVGRAGLGVGPGATIVVVVLALLLTNVSARATGETDAAPVGAVGMLTQGAFAGAGAVTSLMSGGAVTGAASQAVGILYAFRAGDPVGASPRAQVGAQLVGAVVGALVVVPIYVVVVKTYGLGTEALPAASVHRGRRWQRPFRAARCRRTRRRPPGSARRSARCWRSARARVSADCSHHRQRWARRC
jgi:hypothetical protein